MKAFFDVNILLDVVLERHPWFNDANAVCDAVGIGRVDGFVSAATFPTLFYIVRQRVGLDKARETLQMARETFEICPVNRDTVELALSFSGSDFEDNLQMACAHLADMDVIISRDRSGFLNSTRPVLSATELLARIA